MVDEDPPIPGDDLVLNIDIDVQAQAEQALRSGLAIADERPSRGYDEPNKGEVGSTVVLDPKSGGVIAMASFPTFNPAEFVDGISDAEWAYLTDPANNAPLNNWAIQGQYAPGSTFKPFSAMAGLEAGLITPDTTVFDDGEYEVPDCSGDSCTFSNDNKRQYGVVDLRRSLTVSSDFYYYGLGARFWIEQDRVGGPEKYADLLKQWGFDADTGIDLSSEQAGRIPSPEWLHSFCEEVGCADGADSLAHGQQRQHGHRPGRRAAHAAPDRVRLRHHRQRRHRVGAARGQGGARRRHQGAQAHDRARSRPAPIEMRPEWRTAAPRRADRRHHPRGRHRGRRLQRLPLRRRTPSPPRPAPRR